MRCVCSGMAEPGSLLPPGVAIDVGHKVVTAHGEVLCLLDDALVDRRVVHLHDRNAGFCVDLGIAELVVLLRPDQIYDPLLALLERPGGSAITFNLSFYHSQQACGFARCSKPTL